MLKEEGLSGSFDVDALPKELLGVRDRREGALKKRVEEIILRWEEEEEGGGEEGEREGRRERMCKGDRGEVYQEYDTEIHNMIDNKLEELNYLYEDQNREL